MTTDEMYGLIRTVEPLSLTYDSAASNMSTYMAENGLENVAFDNITVIDCRRFAHIINQYHSFDQYVMRGIIESMFSIYNDEVLDDGDVEDMLNSMLLPLFSMYDRVELLNIEFIRFLTRLMPTIWNSNSPYRDMIGWQHSYRLLFAIEPIYYNDEY